MHLIKFLKGRWHMVLLILVLLGCQAFAELMLPTFTADIVDVGIMQGGIEVQGDFADTIAQQQAVEAKAEQLQAAGEDLGAIQMGYLLRVGGLMMLMAALAMAFNVTISFCASRTAGQIGHDLRSRLFAQVVRFSEGEVSKFSPASLITRATNDIQLIQMTITILLRMVLFSPMMAIGGIVMVVNTNASLGWIIVAAIFAVVAVISVLFVFTMPKFRIIQSLIDKVNLIAREKLTGLPVIRAFRRERFEEERFDDASAELMRTQLFTNRAMAFMMPSVMMIMNLAAIVIVWFGSGNIDAGIMQPGDLIAFITYSMVIISSFLILSMVVIILPRAEVASQRIQEVLAAEPAVQDAEDVRDDELSSPDDLRGVSIEFRNVSFGYPESKAQVLEDVSFAVGPGETCAIVGATGSGKSTVLKLIERFYDVSSGEVLVDGIDVRELSQNALRRQFGYVPQKAFLFSGTIESNLSYGHRDELAIEIEESAALVEGPGIEQAAEIAQAAEFINEKDDGYQTAIAQGGTNVSGGQRQRLAIARALAVPARAYLFDDSFSALDYKTDSQLRAALADQLAGRTVIIVAQRIATVMNADNIVVLEEGRVVGMGRHEELLDSCDQYREIALSQLSEEELRGGERHE